MILNETKSDKYFWKYSDGFSFSGMTVASGIIGWGHTAPRTFFTGKFLLTYRESRGKEKRENEEEKKENYEREGRKLKMEVEEVWKWAEDLFLFLFFFFFFFLLFTFWNHYICLGCTKWKISTRGRGELGKVTVSPLKNIPVTPLTVAQNFAKKKKPQP